MSAPTVSPAVPRPALRSVALPSEHGGWGLTMEPGLLGLLVAPSVAGACLAVAATVAFLVRTPLKVALVDHRRGRCLPRTVLARRVAAAELVVLACLVAFVALRADARWWVPALVAAPLVLVEAWYDVRSRGRRLVPELAGAVGVASVVAMIVLAGGGTAGLAAAAWLVLAARITTSIPSVRAQVARLHGRAWSRRDLALADVAAVLTAAVAVWVDRAVFAGAVAVLGVVVAQRALSRGAVPRPVVLGLRQMAFGFGVVLVTAAGVLATTP